MLLQCVGCASIASLDVTSQYDINHLQNVGSVTKLMLFIMPADILEAPGSNHLVVTHKSMMRAFLCTALALPPTSFRAVDIHNGGVSIFK